MAKIKRNPEATARNSRNIRTTVDAAALQQWVVFVRKEINFSGGRLFLFLRLHMLFLFGLILIFSKQLSFSAVSVLTPNLQWAVFFRQICAICFDLFWFVLWVALEQYVSSRSTLIACQEKGSSVGKMNLDR